MPKLVSWFCGACGTSALFNVSRQNQHDRKPAGTGRARHGAPFFDRWAYFNGAMGMTRSTLRIGRSRANLCIVERRTKIRREIPDAIHSEASVTRESYEGRDSTRDRVRAFHVQSRTPGRPFHFRDVHQHDDHDDAGRRGPRAMLDRQEWQV